MRSKLLPAKLVENDEDEMNDKPKPQFRGFVGGKAFITKKGYKGMKLDNIWVKHLFDAFENDDEELAEIALNSQLADVKDVVVGGYDGASYSIGDFGFYTKNQFDFQLETLKEQERKKLAKNAFLSVAEWEMVDEKLSNIARHGKTRFERAIRGDTWCALAVRMNAYEIAKILLAAGIDPLLENENHEDLFDIAKQQYQHLIPKLIEAQNCKMEASRRVVVPTHLQKMADQEKSVVSHFQQLSLFAGTLKASFEARAREIANDKILQRRAHMRNEPFSEEKLWNIAQGLKVQQYLTECVDLIGYISEKLAHHARHSTQFDSLADLLIEHLALIEEQKALPGDGVRDNDDVSVLTANNSSIVVEQQQQLKLDGGMKRIMAADGGGSADFLARMGLQDGDFLKQPGADEVNSVSFLNAKAAGIEQYSKPLGVLKKTDNETIMYR